MDTAPLELLVAELKKSNVRQYTCVNDSGYSQVERNIVDKLTNWQKEKDKVIIDKLSEALAKLVNWHKAHEPISFIEKEDLENADQLLSYLKEQQSLIF